MIPHLFRLPFDVCCKAAETNREFVRHPTRKAWEKRIKRDTVTGGRQSI